MARSRKFDLLYRYIEPICGALLNERDAFIPSDVVIGAQADRSVARGPAATARAYCVYFVAASSVGVSGERGADLQNLRNLMRSLCSRQSTSEGRPGANEVRPSKLAASPVRQTRWDCGLRHVLGTHSASLVVKYGARQALWHRAVSLQGRARV